MRLSIIITLSILLSFSSNFYAQSKVQIPKNSNGSPIVSEKFEMLSYFINERILNQNPISTEIEEFEVKLERKSQGEVLVTSDGENEFEIHAAVNPQNPSNIVAAAISFDGMSMTAPIALAIYASFDDGQTWEKSTFSGDVEIGLNLGGGDPILAFDDQGQLYLTWLLISFTETLDNGFWGFYSAVSDDGGLTWLREEDPIVVEEFTDILFLSDLNRAPDKQWMAADISDSSPFKGNVYMAYTMLQIDSDQNEVDYEITFVKKPSGLTEFEKDSIVINSESYIVAQFTSIDTDNQGNIYVSFLGDDSIQQDEYSLFFIKSEDGGETFSKEEKIININFPEIGSGNYGIDGLREDRLYPCPHLAVDKSSGPNEGRIYFTFTGFGFDPTNVTGADIYLMHSDDQGDTWSIPQLVNNDPGAIADQYYSSITVSELGDVIVSWYDRREDATGTNTNYYLGVSKDGGESFIQTSVSSNSSDFDVIGNSNEGFGIGEYTQVVNTGKYAIPFWADGRTNDGDIAIYAFIKDLEDLSGTNDKRVQINAPFALEGPFPNPATHLTELRLDIKSNIDLSYSILTVDGKVMYTSAPQNYPQGLHLISIDTKALVTGEYIINMRSDKTELSKKLIVK